MTIIRVIDFETTGTAPPEAEVCEVGLCDLYLESGEISVPLTWMCGVKAMPPEVRAVHHISIDECEGWDAFDPAKMLDDTYGTPDAIAAHNAEFETQFFTSPIPVICTYKVALRVWPDAPSHSNGALRYWLEDQGKIAPVHAATQPAHRAGPDAYVTANILKALFDTGVTGKQMVAWTKEPRLLPKCPIGAEWRGKPWREVDAGFLRWMTNNATMESDLKWNAQRELDRRGAGEN
jgi:exodeoxyribonuclease X